MTVSERRTKIRRNRVLNFYKELVRIALELRHKYLHEVNPENKENLWQAYQNAIHSSFMFKYGVAMADPYGKWTDKFNKAYKEIEKEFE